MKTYKETCVHVIQKLIAQGGLSYETKLRNGSPDIVCLYRSTVDGQPRCCAAGVLISDEDYRDKMERNSVLGLVESFPGVLKDHELEIVARLQRFHDSLARNDIACHLPQLETTLAEIQQGPDINDEVYRKMREIIKEIEAAIKISDEAF